MTVYILLTGLFAYILKETLREVKRNKVTERLAKEQAYKDSIRMQKRKAVGRSNLDARLRNNARRADIARFNQVYE